MKRWLSFLMISVFAFGLAACHKEDTPPETKELVTVYLQTEYTENGQPQRTFRYDANGNLLENNSYLPYTGTHYRKTYQYDAHNREIACQSYCDEELESDRTLCYNEKGELIRIVNHPIGTGSGWERHYVYDKAGRQIEEYIRQNGEERIYHRYTYDANGNLLEDITYYGIEEITTYTYDSQNRPTQKKTTYDRHLNDNIVSTEELEIYTYEDHSRITYSQDRENGELMSSIISVRKYDDMGNEICWQLFSAAAAGQLDTAVPRSEHTYRYDEAGNLLEHRVYKNGVLELSEEYTYNQYGDYLSYTHHTYRKSIYEGVRDEVCAYTYECEYDEAGNLLKETRYKNGELERIRTFSYIALQVTAQRAEELKELYPTRIPGTNW